MPIRGSSRSSATLIRQRIQDLLSQRQQHVAAVARIEATIEEIERMLGTGDGGERQLPLRRSSLSGPTIPSRQTRLVRGSLSGPESLLAFIASRGTTSAYDISQHWKAEGRKGKPLTRLAKLVRSKKLKRTTLPGQRGSEYSVTDASATDKRSTKNAVFSAKAETRGSLTAEQSVMQFVKASENPSTQEINQNWKSQDRRGNADNILSLLVKAKKLNRRKINGKRGSTYSLP